MEMGVEMVMVMTVFEEVMVGAMAMVRKERY